MPVQRFFRVLLFATTMLAAVRSNAALTPGNVVVYRVGDGSSPLTNAAAPVFLDEYGSDGTLSQSIALPTATAGPQHRVTASGTGSEGLITRSLDRQYLVLGGYDATIGTADVGSTGPGTVNRVIGRVDAAGLVDTSTALSNSVASGSIRSVASTDGSQFWFAGSANGARYVAALGATGAMQVNTFSNPVADLRHVALFENKLYASAQSGSSYRIARIGGSSPPTVPGWASTPLPGLPVNSGAPEAFFLVDLNGNGLVDTLYVADSVAGIQKWFLTGGTWVARGALPLASARGLTAAVDGTTVTLFVTNETSLCRVTDASGLDASITGTVTTIATAAPNTSFRGVAHAPAPPPPAVVSIVGTPPLFRANGPVEYTVTFDRPVTGVDASDFDVPASGLISAAVASVSGSGTTYVVSINATGEGNFRLFLEDDDSITDGTEPLGGVGAGNGDAITGDSFILYPPTVVSSIAIADANPTTATTVRFTVSFSRSVTGFDAADLAVVSTGALSGSIASITAGPASVYTVAVNTGGSGAAGTLRLDFVDIDSVFDERGVPVGGFGEGNGNFTGPVYSVERVPHVVSLVRAEASPAFQTPLSFAVTFDAPVSGVDAMDFAATATGTVVPAIAAVSGTGSAYRVDVSTGGPGVSGTLRLDFVDDDSVVDGAQPVGGAGAGNGDFAGQVYEVVPGPVVLSVTRAGGSPTSAASVELTVTFSNPVTGVDPTDFSVVAAGLTGASVSAVAGGPAVYTVTVASGTGVGTLRLDVVDDDSIRAGGVPLNGFGSNNGDFTTGEEYQIDRDPPAVIAIRRGYASPTSSTNLGFQIEFDQFVRGVDGADFAITTTGSVFGTAILIQPYPEGVSTSLAVTYQGGEGTIRLDVVDGATIANGLGIPLQSGFTSGEVYVVDRPVVHSIVRAGVNPTRASSVTWTVTFTEPMNGVDASDFVLFGIGDAAITGVAGSGATCSVTADTGSSSGELQLSLNDDDSIIDATGTPLGGSGAGNGSFFLGERYELDRNPPYVNRFVRASANPATGPSVAYDVSFGDAVTGVDVTDFDVVTHGVTGALVTGITDSGTAYRVLVGTGAGAGTLQLRLLDDDSITDAVGNPLSGAGGSPPLAGLLYWVNGAVPEAPTDLRAVVGDGAVELMWEPNAGSASCSVRRSMTSGGPYVELGPAGSTYYDTDVVNGTTYYYVVRALEPESGDSEEVAATPDAPAVLGVVISQIYGGGGESGAPYGSDFVELFNRGTQAVSLWGWSLQSFDATDEGRWQKMFLGGTIEPGRYYLIEAQSSSGPSGLPDPDGRGFIDIGTARGEVALVASPAALDGCSGSGIADLVGFGENARCSETAPAPAPSGVTAIFRANEGCVDSNDNASDLEVRAPAPRNSSTAAYACGPSIPPQGTGAASPPTVVRGFSSLLTVTVMPGQNPPSTAISVSADLSSIGGSATQSLFDDGTSGDVTPNDLVYSYEAIVQPDTGIGTKELPSVISDAQGRSTSAVIALDVQSSPPPPPPPPPPVPSHLVATAGDAEVLLEWNGRAGTDAYRVKRATTSGGPYTTIAGDVALMSYTDRTVTNGVRYYYVVSARLGEVESGNSAETSALPTTTPPTPLTATHFQVVAPASVTRGIPFSVTVTALDAANAVVTNYTGTVHFTSAPGDALPPESTFAEADHGSRTFTVTLTPTGMRSMTVSDGFISGTALIVVDCGTSLSTLTIVLADSVCPMSMDHRATVQPVAGATSYDWEILNGTITGGQGTTEITFIAGASTSVGIQVSVSGGACPIARGNSAAAIAPRPAATLPESMKVCPGERVDISARLAGTAPFVVLWSDGLRQTTATNEAHRSLSVDGVSAIRVESVTDALCEGDGPSNRMTFELVAPPAIVVQPQSVRVRRGAPATLSIVAAGEDLRFAWFEGAAGDTRRPVGTRATLVTPPIETSTTYWVRVSGSCGHVDSQEAAISVQGRRRSARS